MNLEAAHQFLWTHARVLERRIFEHRFLGAPSDAVGRAVDVYRNADGSARGVTLGEALSEIVGVDYETRVGGTDPAHQVLYRIGNRTTYDVCDERSDEYDAVECDATQAHGFWVVAGSGRAFTAASRRGGTPRSTIRIIPPRRSMCGCRMVDRGATSVVPESW